MSKVKTRYDEGVSLIPTNVEGVAGEDLTRDGDLAVDSSDNELKVRLDGATRTVVTENQTQTLTNKSIDADNNPISNLEVDNLKSGVLNTSNTLSGASDSQVPSAKATKDYVDSNASSLQEDIDDLVTLSGVSVNSTDLGTFTGSTIPDNSTIKEALQELETAVETASGDAADVAQDLEDHINNPIGAHAASAISNTPSGNLSATNVQTALNELQGDVDLRVVAPSSSVVNNSVALFDGTSGKLLKQSPLLYSSSTNTFSISGQVSQTGSTSLISEYESGVTGSEALILGPITQGRIRLNASGLVSVAGIEQLGDGRLLYLTNDTGDSISIINQSGAVSPGYGFITGTGDDITLPYGATLQLLYNDDLGAYLIVGGVGGGAGVVKVTAGETLAINDLVYISTSSDTGRTTGRAYKAIANNDNRVDVIGFVLKAATTGDVVEVQVSGVVEKFSGLTAGVLYYLSATTAGAITSTPPSTNYQWIVSIGIAASSDRLVLNSVASASAIYINNADFETVIENNKSATNITNLYFDPIGTKGFIVDYFISRKTTTNEATQIGQLRGAYNSKNLTWSMSDNFSGDDAGVEFTILPSGQIRYASSDLTGSDYLGKMTYNIVKVFK